MPEISIRPRAKSDIKKIWQYTYKHWGEKQADIYTKELGEAIHTLADNPMIGIGIDQILQDYRLYHFSQHLVIYRLLSNHSVTS
jgi:toxin ParE1/3/4